MQRRHPWHGARRICAITVAVVLAGMAAGCGAPSEPHRTAPLVDETPRTAGPGFPDASTTGPPAGLQLAPYDGPCVLDVDGTVVQGRVVVCDRLVVLADVTVRASRVEGRIDVDAPGARLTLEDSEVDAGTVAAPAVGFADLTVRRSHIRGGQTSVQCGSRCVVEDSLLEDQMSPVADQHLGGFLSNGGSEIVVRGNTIACTPPDNGEGGGCTGALQLFGDVAEVTDVRVEGNLVRATPGGFCASFGHNPGKPFGEAPTGIVVVGNVFERGAGGRCGSFGATTSFLAAGEGNRWEGNTWDDGSPLRPDE